MKSEKDNLLYNKNVIVTGGAGFIPSHIVDNLVNRGAKVTVIDNLSEGKIENLNDSINHIEFIEGDICNRKLLEKIVKNAYMIYHFAGNANVPRSVDDPEYDFRNNIQGSFFLLESLRKFNNKCKVVFASTAGVYGPPRNIPMNENDPVNPISPYGASKLSCEKIGLSYDHCFGIRFLPVRIFNSFGPRQPRYVIYDLIKKLKKNNKKLTVLGTGDEIRDYTYVGNTAEMIIELSKLKNIYSKPVNICSSLPIKIKDLVNIILDVLNLKNTTIDFTGQSWPGDIKVLLGDNKRLLSLINYKYDKNDLVKGIKELVKEIE